MIALLVLWAAAEAFAGPPTLYPITGHRTCHLIQGSNGECAEGPSDVPKDLTYDVREEKISVDWQDCRGRKLRYAFHFHDENCELAALWPVAGKPDQLLVETKKGCAAYYTCSDPEKSP